MLAQAEAALHQRLVHGQQDEPLLVGFEACHGGVIREVAVQDPLFRQAAAFVFIRAHRLDHGLGVGIDALRLEQHPTAELQLPHHAGTGQQAHHRLQFFVGEPRDFAGQAQLQRLAQFVEAHQHPAFVLEADDLLLEPLEEQRRGAPGNVLPTDAVEDGLLEFLAAQVGLGAGFQQLQVAAFLREGFDLSPADAQAAGIHAPGDQQLGELLREARVRSRSHWPSVSKRSSFWPSKTSTASAVSSM